MKSPHKGVKRILKAFVYSYDGFVAAFKSEAAFRQELALVIVGIIAAFFVPASALGRGLMISSLLLILIVELANSAIEAVVDRVGEEYHALSKKAKDIGSLMVLLSFLNAAVVWVAVLW